MNDQEFKKCLRRERELLGRKFATERLEYHGVIKGICAAWDHYHRCDGPATKALSDLDKEIEAAARLIGHTREVRYGG